LREVAFYLRLKKRNFLFLVSSSKDHSKKLSKTIKKLCLKITLFINFLVEKIGKKFADSCSEQTNFFGMKVSQKRKMVNFFAF